MVSHETDEDTSFSANVMAQVSKATSSVSFKVLFLVGIALVMYTAASTESVSKTREYFKMKLLLLLFIPILFIQQSDPRQLLDL